VAVNLGNICLNLLAEAEKQLEDCGSGPVCTSAVFNGIVAWDYCGECSSDVCGFAYVRLAQSYPSSIFPQPSLDLSCAAPLTHQLELGVIRCVPTLGDDGDPPDPVEVTASALGFMEDMEALKHAATLVLPKTNILSNWVPVGPQGGCGGGYWSIYLSEY
jgi:hypothetical protein